jgi:hypothetical protein
MQPWSAARAKKIGFSVVNIVTKRTDDLLMLSSYCMCSKIAKDSGNSCAYSLHIFHQIYSRDFPVKLNDEFSGGSHRHANVKNRASKLRCL